MSDERRRQSGQPSQRDRHGARQPERFDAERAPILDDHSRFEYLPPERIFALLRAPAGGRVVDFGTGTGLFALELARRRPDLEVIALDEQPPMLARLRANPALATLANVKPLLSENQSGLSGTADAVLAINVLHELGDEALQELARLLKPSGTAVVVDWNGALDRPFGPPRDHVYTPAEGRARLQQAGLRVIEQPALPYHYVLTAQPR